MSGLVLLGAAVFRTGDRLRPLNRVERKQSDAAARDNGGKEKAH